MRRSVFRGRGSRAGRSLRFGLGLAVLFSAGLLTAAGALGETFAGGGTTSDSTPAVTDTGGAATTAPTTDTTTADTTTADTTTATSGGGSDAVSTTPLTLTPTIAGDQADYAPGSTVTLTGSGWGPAEGVHLFVNDTAGQTWQLSDDVTADLDGSFVYAFQLPNWFVATYGVTATGAAGETAATSFTDAANTTTAVASSLNPSFAGQPVTFTATVTSSGAAVTVGQVKFGTGGNCTGGFSQLQAAQTVDTGGRVQYTTSSLAVGSTTIRACYLGTGGGGTQDSAATVTQTVNAKQSQTITFAQPASPQAYAGAFHVNPTASSGLPVAVTAEAGSVCTVSPAPPGYDVTMTAGSGNCVLDADQAGDAGHNAAATVTRTVVAQKAGSTTTVTCPAGPYTYDGTAQTPCTATVTGAGGLNVTPTPSYADNTNAGTATASYTYAGDANHDGSDGSDTFTIGARPVTASITAEDKTYDGTDGATVSDCSLGDPVAAADSVGCEASDAHFGTSSAGPATVTATVALTGAKTADYELTSTSASALATIDKADAVIDVTPYHVTYDGDPHTATGTATGVESPTPADLTALLHLGGTTHTDAGDHPDDAWTFDGNQNYNADSGTVDDRIDKADADCSTVAGYSVTYDGDPHTAAGACTGVDGQPLAGLDLTGTTHTDAGAYADDPWTFTDQTGNYNDGNGTVDDQIDKADAVIDVTPYHVTYDGDPHTASGTASGVESPTPTDLTPLLHLGGTSHTDAGDYTDDAWSFEGNTNYKASSGTVHDQIDKAGSTTTVTCPAGPYTYDGTAQTPCSAAVAGAGGLDQSLGVDYSDNVHAGTAHASAAYPGDANHEPSGDATTFSIDPRPVTAAVTAADKTYDGTDDAIITDCSLGDTVAAADGVTCSASNAHFGTSDAGPGTVTADVSLDGPNLDDYALTSATASALATIDKADAVIDVTPYHVTYDGDPHTASGTATGVESPTPADLTTLLHLGGTTHTDAADYSDDAWSFDGDQNYNADSGTVHDRIDKARAIITVTPYEDTYDGDPHTAAGTASGVESPTPADLTALLHLGGTTHLDAGDYADDAWTFDGNANYEADAGTVHDTLAKAHAHITVTPYDVTYDGDPHTAAGTATGVESPAPADLTALLHLGGTAHTDAGDHPADAWSFEGDGNYLPDGGTVHDVIHQAHLTVTAAHQSKTYDGHPFTGFTATFSGFEKSDGPAVVTGSVAFGGPAVAAVDAGSYAIVPDVGGLSAANYDFTPHNGTLTIGKASLTVTADDKSKVFDGGPYSPFTSTIAGFVNGETASVVSGSVTYAGQAVTAVAPGAYPITPVVGGLSATNYDFTPIAGTLTIGAWSANGFYQPVGAVNSLFTAAPAATPATAGAGTVWNAAKGGSTIPLKFNVYAGALERTSLADIRSFQQQKLSSCSAAAATDDPVDLTTTGGTSLRYDGTGGQWIQNWATPKVAADTCYRAWVTFADGSTIEAFFKLKK